MLGIPLRYLLKHPMTGVADLAADPIETWITIREAILEKPEEGKPQCPYQPDLNWEQRLHQALGISWPCDETQEFLEVWRQVISELEAKGMRTGPESYRGWNDGDAGFVRAIWCLTRHLRPKNIIETGVAHGVTSHSSWRRSRGTETAIYGASIFHRWKGSTTEKLGLPLAVVTQIDGRTSRVLVAAACHDCFGSKVRSTFSYTIAVTVSAMFVLNWTRCGQDSDRRV